MPRLSVGDVIEIAEDGEFLYIQYVGRVPVFGECVLVHPVLYETRHVPNAELFRDGYFTVVPANAYIAQGLGRVVARLACDGVPSRWRRAGWRGADGEVLNWFITDGAGEDEKNVSRLSAAEKRLSILEVWTYGLLLKRVKEGWRPEQDG